MVLVDGGNLGIDGIERRETRRAHDLPILNLPQSSLVSRHPYLMIMINENGAVIRIGCGHGKRNRAVAARKTLALAQFLDFTLVPPVHCCAVNSEVNPALTVTANRLHGVAT